MIDLLGLILDSLIPPSADGRMPGAGTLGLAEKVRSQTAASELAVTAGLMAAEAGGFAELDGPARASLLRRIEADQPAFIASVYPATCIAYYEHPEVQRALGLDPRPPYPKGYPLETGSLEGLDRVRERGKLYREV